MALDLDTSKASQAVVDADAQLLRTLLTTKGLLFVEDYSPTSGGRHFYIPLQERMDGAEARELVEAIGRRCPSLDAGPHQTGAHGCIRVPGSEHKRGGHQVLVGSLNTAYHYLKVRNPAVGIRALQRAFAPELHRGAEEARRRETATRLMTAEVSSAAAGHSTALPAAGALSPLRLLARSGLYDTARYPSDSEARMAVLNHLAGSGWSYTDVLAGLEDQCKGLPGLYGSEKRLTRLLPTEWAKAVAWTSEKNAGQARRQKHGHKCNTSKPVTTGGALTSDSEKSSEAIRHLLNDVENVIESSVDDRLARQGREGTSLRLLLRAVIGFCRAQETQVIDVGVRSLATAMGKSHVTIARLLHRLAATSDGVLTKVADGRGKNADLYVVDLPEKHQELATSLSWRRGRSYGVRPVFRVLGDHAALVFEAIERARYSPTTADLIRTTRISAGTVRQALDTMTGLGMIHRRADMSWAITHTTNLRRLAIQLGADVDVAEQIRLYRLQRRRWHDWLARHDPENGDLSPTDLYDHEKDEYWLPPADDLRPAFWAAA
ncbi:hypothetical protein [Arthrobacter woluwensis]|uniref:hypothetical protein n=1 Tax=Arthrobacter woluwensis TaxID=156980 RepID=UPI000A715D44|nr:hypothetical protein [Arthrobacter woluwensis]